MNLEKMMHTATAEKDLIIRKNMELKKFLISCFIFKYKFDSFYECLNTDITLKANILF